MKRYLLGITAIVIAISTAAFTYKPIKEKENNLYANYYFQFNGTRNQDESNRTKWAYLSTQTLPAYTALSCPGANYGCKLIASDTIMISGVAHPKTVYVVSGTQKPTTGTDVSSVANTNTAP